MPTKRDIAATIIGATLTFGAGQALPDKTTPATIQAAQTSHYERYGTYFSVTEYKTPTGERGYQMFYEDDTSIRSEGTGPEAIDRSFTILKVASST